MNKPTKNEIREILLGLKEGIVTVSESLKMIAETVDEDSKRKAKLRRKKHASVYKD